MPPLEITVNPTPKKSNSPPGRVMLENINHALSRRPADARRYAAMKHALLQVLPHRAPGLTVAQAQEQVLAHLPQDLFPGGEKSGWWGKAVQLDLEAKETIRRLPTRPLQLIQT